MCETNSFGPINTSLSLSLNKISHKNGGLVKEAQSDQAETSVSKQYLRE